MELISSVSLNYNNNNYGIIKGDEVAIIGGGNTAIDVARTTLRLGGKANNLLQANQERNACNCTRS